MDLKITDITQVSFDLSLLASAYSVDDEQRMLTIREVSNVQLPGPDLGTAGDLFGVAQSPGR